MLASGGISQIYATSEEWPLFARTARSVLEDQSKSSDMRVVISGRIDTSRGVRGFFGLHGAILSRQPCPSSCSSHFLPFPFTGRTDAERYRLDRQNGMPRRQKKRLDYRNVNDLHE